MRQVVFLINNKGERLAAFPSPKAAGDAREGMYYKGEFTIIGPGRTLEAYHEDAKAVAELDPEWEGILSLADARRAFEQNIDAYDAPEFLREQYRFERWCRDVRDIAEGEGKETNYARDGALRYYYDQDYSPATAANIFFG